MMRLSMMRNFLAAGLPDSEHPIVAGILEKWGYDKGSASFFRASSNIIYTFTINEKKFILRLTDSFDRAYHQVETELAFLSTLTEHQFPVNKPNPSLSGSEIEICETEIGTFYATVFSHIKGKLCDINDLSETNFFYWGKSLGKLHKVSTLFDKQGENEKRPFSYETHLEFIKRVIAGEEEYIHQELKLIESWINNLSKTNQNFGVIHFDYELDNLIWTENNIEVIDFEQCSYYWYTADLAFALRDLFEDGCDLEHPHFQAFLKGYQEEKSISENYTEEIPAFLRFHRLYIFAILLKTMDLGTAKGQENPEWVVNLSARLARKAEIYRSSLRREH